MPARTLASGHRPLKSGPTLQPFRFLTETVPTPSPGPNPEPGLLRCRALRPPHVSKRTNPHRTLKARKATPTTPRLARLSFPAAAAEIANFYGPPPSASRPPFTARPEPPALPSAAPLLRRPSLGGFLPRHPGARLLPRRARPPPGVAAHSPLSAEACRVAPEVPSMTLMVPRLVTARMAFSAGW